MDDDLSRRGLLTGKIYAKMIQFLSEEGVEPNPIDVVRWWSFWEAVVPSDLNPGRLFWLSMVAMVRVQDDMEKSAALFRELEGWLTGDDDVSVEIVELGDDPGPPWN